MALVPEVRFEIAASPVHCPSTGAEGFLCAGVPLLKKLRAATHDENPRAQSRLGQGGGSNPATPTNWLQPFVLPPMWEEPWVLPSCGEPSWQSRSFSDHGKAVCPACPANPPLPQKPSSTSHQRASANGEFCIGCAEICFELEVSQTRGSCRFVRHDH